jgi:alpha-glucosidase
MLASYVVFQDHLPMMADYPSAYRGQPLTRVMAAVPSTWEDTRALSAQPGEAIAIARRSGNDWWIGAMTDRRARDLKLSLSFLPAGPYRAEIYRDDLAAEHGFRLKIQRVTSSDELSIRLAESGGSLVRLMPDPVRAVSRESRASPARNRD